MKENMPLVSIICTNYNKGEWIRDAIESFLSQEVNFAYEIILMDDASTDVSPDIIKEFADKYPSVIRAFYNKTNLGITKTWVKACKRARGKYIARCDGDDYWIDTHKLKKQFELLKRDKESLWCSTDYNIITPDGRLIHKSAFKNKLVDRADSYAKMLVTKGFTMSSTWLVEANLMREVNEEIDLNAVDDTFNIQLDLFNKTKLTFLPEATVVYRINEGSDSRPVDMDMIRSRNEKLLKTQLEYLDKYKDVEYGEMLRILLQRDMQIELWAIERLQIINQQQKHIEQLESNIETLEDRLYTITNHKIYKYTSSFYRLIKKSMMLPRKLIRKLMWLDGRRKYASFYRRNYVLTEEQLRLQADNSNKFEYKPLISIVVPTYNTNLSYLESMIKSVEIQTYPNWELILVDDASPNGKIREYIKNISNQNPKIIYKFLNKNKHIAGATNEGFKLANGEFISLLDHDDVLHPSALYEIVKVLNRNPDIDFIYTDEDKIEDNGKHIDPLLKPDWNQELLYSINYITHFTTIRNKIIKRIGGERSEYNGAQDWDLFIRATNIIKPNNIYHIPKILYSWRMHDSSTAKNIKIKPYVFESQRKLLEDYFKERGLSDNEFKIERNKFMEGAWDVSYKGQLKNSLHLSGDKVDFNNIKGIAMTGKEIARNLGFVSHTHNVYKNCRYTIK